MAQKEIHDLKPNGKFIATSSNVFSLRERFNVRRESFMRFQARIWNKDGKPTSTSITQVILLAVTGAAIGAVCSRYNYVPSAPLYAGRNELLERMMDQSALATFGAMLGALSYLAPLNVIYNLRLSRVRQARDDLMRTVRDQIASGVSINSE